MDSIKAQDIIRHIFKDEDKGVEYVTGLSITDGVEVLTKVLPELIKKAQEKNNVNDEGYFNEIGNVYRKIVVDKLLNADHLWTIYCDSTGYPYMVDDDIVVLYDYTNHARVEEQLGKYGYDISYGIEDKDSIYPRSRSTAVRKITEKTGVKAEASRWTTFSNVMTNYVLQY